jgi:two-component system cell cycle response regulator CtrA
MNIDVPGGRSSDDSRIETNGIRVGTAREGIDLLGTGSAHGNGSAAAPARARFAATGRTTRLLLVEDDRLLSDALSRMLELAGFTVYVTAYGEDALDLARAYKFDVVVLDLSLPDVNGQQVLGQLHQMRPDTPVIILSGEAGLESKIENFLEGADDYITKPFHRDELLVRIHAVLRRARAASPQEIELGSLTLDLVAHRASVNGRPVNLTGKEYACLEFLANRRGMTVTKEMFLAHLYGGRDEPEMKIIDVFICKLRRKLAEAGAPPVIETVWGRGYTIPNEG